MQDDLLKIQILSNFDLNDETHKGRQILVERGDLGHSKRKKK